jgi:virginiamycin B lyase
MIRRACAVAIFCASVASAQEVTEYKLPNPNAQPNYIATSPDGTVWFTEFEGNKVGKIAPDGELTEYPLSLPASRPLGIVVTADGSAWFAESGSSQIGRITTNGQLTEFRTAPLGGPFGDPFRVCASAAGAIYFTEYNTSRIGRIGSDGAFASFSIPPGRGPWACAADAEGNVWFTEWANFNGPTLGRLSPSGVISEYPMPTDASGPPDAIVVTPDGVIALIGTRMTANGVFTAYATGGVPDDVSVIPGDLTVGPDGSLWFTQKYYANDGTLSGSVVRVDQNGQITKYSVNGLPSGVAADQHGGIWVTVYPDRIIRLAPYARRRAVR